MTGTAERRRAERLAVLLEGTGAGPGAAATPAVGDGLDAELAALLTAADALRALPRQASLEPAARERMRTRLVAVATVRPVAPAQPTTAQPVRTTPATGQTGVRWWRRRTLLAGGAAAVVLVASGVGVASTGANPGSPLYGIKRGTESAQLSAAGSSTSRGELLLHFAGIRLSEAGAADPTQASRTLATMDEQTTEGSRLLDSAAVQQHSTAPLDSVQSFLARQRPRLITLLARHDTPPEHAAAVDALVLLDRVQLRVDGLRTSLTCASTTSAGSDDLGPLPVACAGTPSAGSGSPSSASPGTTGSAQPTPGGSGGTAPPSPVGGTRGSTGSGSGAGATSGGAPAPTPTAGGATGGLDGLLGGLAGPVLGILNGLGASPSPSPSPSGSTGPLGGVLPGVG